jgi:signal transduction histidine kinase
MRTPLSNINMGLKLIENKTPEKSEKEKIRILVKSVDRLSNQINNVMDFVRTREPTLGIWDLNSILQESLDQLKIPDSIKITLPKENLSIKCDKELFEILFLNLIKNSLESIKENGVIKCHAENNPKEIIIKIEDSGSGIPEEYLPEIFDPLVTLKNSFPKNNPIPHTGIHQMRGCLFLSLFYVMKEIKTTLHVASRK